MDFERRVKENVLKSRHDLLGFCPNLYVMRCFLKVKGFLLSQGSGEVETTWKQKVKKVLRTCKFVFWTSLDEIPIKQSMLVT